MFVLGHYFASDDSEILLDHVEAFLYYDNEK